MIAKLAASNIAWEPQEDEAVAAVLRAAGFTGIEIAPTTRWPRPLEASEDEIRAVRSWWGDRGFEIVALQALLFGRPDLRVFGTDQERDATLQYLGGIAALAAHLGARSLVFGSPGNRKRGEMPIDQAMEIAVAFFTRAAAIMEDHGVQLCFEPNPPEYGCDFVTTTAQAIELASRVGRPGLRVQGDLGAITMVGDAPGQALAVAGPQIGHFHASEPGLAETGTAGADHASAARALAANRYQGWVSIEMRKAAGDRVEAVARAARLVRETYGPSRT